MTLTKNSSCSYQYKFNPPTQKQLYELRDIQWKLIMWIIYGKVYTPSYTIPYTIITIRCILSTELASTEVDQTALSTHQVKLQQTDDFSEQ